MADLYFPQLTSGAIAHYPIRQTYFRRTITNVAPDGTLTLLPDDGADRVTWNWDYSNLSSEDVGQLKAFFGSCNGPLQPFTFLAPTGNYLAQSSAFNTNSWRSANLQLGAEPTAPVSGVAAFTVTNVSQAIQELNQGLSIPAGYQYCFSLYAKCTNPQPLVSFRRGVSVEQTGTVTVGPTWTRIWSQGVLTDESTQLTVGIQLVPGQQVSVSAAQLESQVLPSPYRNRANKGDVYSNAHWAIDELEIRAEAPEVYSASISIEAAG